jgi:L-fucose isomerase-like protein
MLFLAGDSWWEAGICDAKVGPYAGFIDNVESDVAAVTKALEQECDVVSSGLLHTAEQVAAEAQRFTTEHVDAIVFCPIIWTNDAPVVALLREAKKVPLALWAYDPYGGFPDYFTLPVWLRTSGPVSVQQSSNILQRFGWDYEVIFGNEKDGQTRQDLTAFIRAAAVKKSLVGTRIAMLPAPCDVVISSWVDQFQLLEQFGVELTYVSVDRYAKLCDSVSDADAAEYVNWLKSKADIVDTPDDILHQSAKQALAMVRLAEDERLSGIGLEDFNPDIYRILGFRPHLTHPRLGELGCTVGLESDVPGILATIIVGRLAGRPAMFNEFFSIDPNQNTALMGHPGMGEISVGDPATFTVTPDLEFDETQPRGVWFSYRAKPGSMTFLNLTPERGELKAAAFSGESLPGVRLMEGYAHMLIKPDIDALDLYKRIVSLGLLQHWGTVHGSVLSELRSLSKMLGLGLHDLSEGFPHPM